MAPRSLLPPCHNSLPSALRALFKEYDGRSYGYITAEQLKAMLHSLCWLAADDVQFLLPIMDPRSCGRISYRALYHSLSTVGAERDSSEIHDLFPHVQRAPA
jgi:Ca2+-binding EF-hand superfamily protein